MLIVAGVFIVAFACAPNYTVVLVSIAVIGLCVVIARGALDTISQALSPDTVRGRVQSAVNLLVVSATAVAKGISAVLGSLIGVQAVFVAAGVVTALTGMAAIYVLRGAASETSHCDLKETTTMNFHSKHVIVTGGSSGIGKAIARLLAQRGANVTIVARRQTLLDATMQELEAMRVDQAQVFQAFSADLSDLEQARAAINVVTADGRTPAVLINAAGFIHPGYFEELPIEIFRQTMEVDFFGTLYPCKLVAPLMIEQHSGHIVNFSSVAGFLGVFGYTAYGAAKFAIRGFSDALRAELKPRGVRVSVVFPPDTDTPSLHYEDQFKPLETRRLASSAGLMKPEQVAQAVIKGIEKNRYIITPGSESTFFFWLTNPAFGFVHWYMDKVIAGARKEA